MLLLQLVSFFILFNLILAIFLALAVMKKRMKLQVSLGDGNNKLLQRSIRAHMNHLENLILGGFFLILMYLNQAAFWAVLIFGNLFSISRCFIAFALSSDNENHIKFRMIGNIQSLISYVFAILVLLYLLIQ